MADTYSFDLTPYMREQEDKPQGLFDKTSTQKIEEGKSFYQEMADMLKAYWLDEEEAYKPKAASVSDDIELSLYDEYSKVSPEYARDIIEGLDDAASYREQWGIETSLRDVPVMLEEQGDFVVEEETPVTTEELPAIDPETGQTIKSADDVANEVQQGLMSRPSTTESVNLTATFVDEMERLEGLGGDTLLGNRKPTYAYGITKQKANEYGMKPEDYGSMREFAEAFAGRYMAEKEEQYSDIFAGKSDREKIALHSYLYNAGKFYDGQLAALESNDMQGFIHELRDVVKSEGKAVTGLSKRRAEEANMLGESIEGWKPISEVRVRGTREKPIFDWVAEDGTVVESYESNVPLHKGSSMRRIKV